jgi:hypothetical protein
MERVPSHMAIRLDGRSGFPWLDLEQEDQAVSAGD